MPHLCEVILKGDATAQQLTDVGAALWRWCTGSARQTGIYEYLDNQSLNDLINGQLPRPSLALESLGRYAASCRLRHLGTSDRQSTIKGLRQVIPTAGIDDILIDGKSWNQSD